MVRVDRWTEEHVALAADGRVYASTGGDLPTIVGAGLLPALAAPERPLHCAVIGLGSGVEASALAGLGCARVDVFERRDDVFDVATALGTWVDGRLLRAGAGGPFRRRTEPPGPEERYDVIVQAVASTAFSRPYRLFTVERFTAIRSHLAPNGVFLQHVQMYDVHGPEHRRMMQTLAATFGHLVVVAPESWSSDSLVLASSAPIRFDVARVAAWREVPGTRRWSDAMRVETAAEVLARTVFVSRAEVMSWAGEVEPYTAGEPMSPDRMPARPPMPGPSSDPEVVEAWDDAMETYTAQFDDEYVRAFYGDAWPHGVAWLGLQRSCALATGEPNADAYVRALIAAGRYHAALIVIEARAHSGARVGPSAELLTIFVDPSAAPADDPLDPFPAGVGERQRESTIQAWAHREEDPSEAIGWINGSLNQLRVPESRAALNLAGLIAAVSGDRQGFAAVYVDELQRDHVEWCASRDACLYWVARGYDLIGDGQEAVRWAERYLARRDAAP